MIEIIDGGLGLTVQDYPGRIGYWNIGIPPSGPMDPFAFRLANRLAGNEDGDAGLEITGMGPTLLFHDPAVIVLGGAKFAATMDREELPWWTPVEVPKGARIKIGRVIGGGFRAYLAIRGGIDVPEYLGSRSTFAYGKFGGFEGRPLKKGDMLEIFTGKPVKSRKNAFNVSCMPQYTSRWEIGALPGPHGCPDFFTEESADLFFSSDYHVNYNANRLGIRLEGPKPVFARADGGEGGRHPSNMHDYTYAIGTVNFSGDTPIIIGVDGPSLGGFISFCTVPTAELWKVGQVKPGDVIHFRKMTLGEAIELQREMETILSLV
ncbi:MULTISPECIES: 5-oxoprolinase/urea amidolyase family protein [Anaerotruncus]|jgi:urea carboxylase|uniref:5-oxoprolinase/urea amidolyase family protein n=1 Tax=Anaerotruncus TaxID=244127 RepID=UPI000E546660|nr:MULTISPECIES: 5-oxoprolinase/urea amidolyase family protein [Anaerotruncus]RGX56246.1 hypothetical protein DWV16_04010 [Anaerotruncus sp. AF02-27]